MTRKQLIQLANIWVNPRNRSTLMTSAPFRALMAQTQASIRYGVWLATPRHHKHSRRIMRHGIATTLLNQLHSS